MAQWLMYSESIVLVVQSKLLGGEWKGHGRWSATEEGAHGRPLGRLRILLLIGWWSLALVVLP